jgi:hypothetical protein
LKNVVLNKVVVTASGHIYRRWRKELVQPSSISEITTWIVEMPRNKNSRHAKCRNVKTPFGIGCDHRLRPHVKGKVKGAKDTRLNRLTV